MALAIGNIIELIGPDRARLMFRGKPRGEAPREFHVIVGVGIGDRWNLDQFGALQPQQIFLFLALGVGNDDHRLVAQGIGDQREADPGIARGAFDDQSAGPQAPLRDRVVNNGESGAVFHRSAGVHELSLAQNRAAGQFRRMAQLDERGSPDRCDDICRNAHFSQRSSPAFSKIYGLPVRSVEPRTVPRRNATCFQGRDPGPPPGSDRQLPVR